MNLFIEYDFFSFVFVYLLVFFILFKEVRDLFFFMGYLFDFLIIKCIFFGEGIFGFFYLI